MALLPSSRFVDNWRQEEIVGALKSILRSNEVENNVLIYNVLMWKKNIWEKKGERKPHLFLAVLCTNGQIWSRITCKKRHGSDLWCLGLENAVESSTPGGICGICVAAGEKPALLGDVSALLPAPARCHCPWRALPTRCPSRPEPGSWGISVHPKHRCSPAGPLHLLGAQQVFGDQGCGGGGGGRGAPQAQLWGSPQPCG